MNNGFLDIDDLSQMAMLTADQFSVNVFADDVLGKASLFHVAFDYKDMLRLYAKLNKQQRNRIFTQQGLIDRRSVVGSRGPSKGNPRQDSSGRTRTGRNTQ